MISSISPSEIVNAALCCDNSEGHKANAPGRPEPLIFFWIAAPVTDTAAVNLANG